jgi:hypothetical protein
MSKIYGSVWTHKTGIKYIQSKGKDETTKCINSDLSDEIKSHHKYIDSLSDFEKELINAYCDNSRNYTKDGKYRDYKEQLNEIINNAPKIDKNICVWRSHGFMTPHKIDDTIINDRFLSTSLDFEVALGFLRSSPCCFYEITINKNTPLLIITDYFKRNEKEIILPLYSKIKIYSKYTINNTTAYICICTKNF